MHRFWDIIIKPAFMAANAGIIVEIGADSGDNTHNILEYCKSVGGFAHVIDPVPKFDIVKWEQEYEGLVKFHISLSLNVLSSIENPDAILIDGDHNWYTVYHELKIIEKNILKLEGEFPLVFLHDMCWPYARRDLYYNPDNIPDAFRKPCKKKGMIPESGELVEHGGLNAHLFNAIYENNFQSGVLTAVEDFISESKYQLKLSIIPAFNGLGILYSQELGKKQKFEKLISELTLSSIQNSLVSRLERKRIEFFINDIDQKQKLNSLIEQVNKTNAALTQSREELTAQNKELSKVFKEQEQLRGELDQSSRERKQLRGELDQSSRERKQLRGELGQATREKEQLRGGMEQASREKAKLDSELSQNRQILQQKNILINEYFIELARAEQSLADHLRLQTESKLFTESIRKLDNDFQDVVKSARWKVGSAIIRFLELIMLKKKQPLAVDHMREVFTRIREFDKNTCQPSEFLPEFIHISHDFDQLNSWIRKLNNDYIALKKSLRWKTGNVLIRGVELLMFKPRQAMATDHLEKIFRDYKDRSTSFARHDQETLKNWLRQINNDFKDLMNSWRWKAGDGIFSFVDRIFLRGKQPTAMDHAQKILAEFESRYR